MGDHSVAVDLHTAVTFGALPVSRHDFDTAGAERNADAESERDVRSTAERRAGEAGLRTPGHHRAFIVWRFPEQSDG